MRDSSIGRLFSKVTVEPDSAFISALERRLRSELVAPMSFDHRTESVSIGEELSDGDALTIDLDGYAGPSLAVGPRVDHRRRRVSAMLLATAAAVIVTAVVIVSTASDHHVITSVPTTIGKPATSDPATTTSEPTPSTTTPQTIPIWQPAGFVQDLATDLTTADGSTFHVDATVTFKVAIESNESSEQANHDVLLLPRSSAPSRTRDRPQRYLEQPPSRS